MKNIIKNFEKSMEKFAIALSASLSSMTMFWIIALLIIIPLFFNQPTTIVGWM